MIIGGLNGAVASFTGQNFGAGKLKRIKRDIKRIDSWDKLCNIDGYNIFI